jgi:putative transposase
MHATREILNDIFYVVRGGCAWKLLPNDLEHPGRDRLPLLPLLALGRDVGEDALRALRKRRVRVRLKRNPQPSAGIVDSQSIKTTGVGGQERAYDGAKKVKGSLSDTSWWTRRRGWCSK